MPAEQDKFHAVFLSTSENFTNVMWGAPAMERLERYGIRATLPALNNTSTLDYPELLKDADAIITTWGSPRIDEELLQYAPKLKFVGHAAGSVAGIISDALYDCGIKVTTANPIMAESVAEWALMMTLIAARAPENYANFYGLKQFDWNRREEAGGIQDKVVGLWGLGDISRRLLKMLQVVTPRRILIHSGHASAEELAQFGAEAVSLEQLLAESDIVHLLAGMTEQNQYRIAAKELALLQDGATLINEGRARLVEPESLHQELQTGRIKGIFDVYYKEPPTEDDPLRTMPNVIMTPHNAAHPGRERYVPFLLDEINRFLHADALHAEISRTRSATMTNHAVAH